MSFENIIAQIQSFGNWVVMETTNNAPALRSLNQLHGRFVESVSTGVIGENIGSENAVLTEAVVAHGVALYAMLKLADFIFNRTCDNGILKFAFKAVLITSGSIVATAIFGGSLPIVTGVSLSILTVRSLLTNNATMAV